MAEFDLNSLIANSLKENESIPVFTETGLSQDDGLDSATGESAFGSKYVLGQQIPAAFINRPACANHAMWNSTGDLLVLQSGRKVPAC